MGFCEYIATYVEHTMNVNIAMNLGKGVGDIFNNKTTVQSWFF